MLNRLVFKRFLLAPGNAIALKTSAGARLRVVNGTVWATTSGSLDDVWLVKGQEHRFARGGLTVIESTTPSIVELKGSRRMYRTPTRARSRALELFRRLVALPGHMADALTAIAEDVVAALVPPRWRRRSVGACGHGSTIDPNLR